MRALGLVMASVLLAATPAASQQLRDTRCLAPVDLDDADCANVGAADLPPELEGSVEQRDDGYYVFVPKANTGD